VISDFSYDNIDYSRYSRDEKEALLTLLQEKTRRSKAKRILTFYPPTGPLRRELYVPHMKFFAAGKEYKERAMLSANRCITPWTPLEMDHATRLPLEILGEQEFYIRSWDGENRCNKKASGLFLKSIAPMFRVYLDNGSFFDCSCKHQLLTSAGWISFDRLIHASSGLHCWRKDVDCQANYDMGNCLYGPPLQEEEDIFQALFPLQDDVHLQSLLSLPWDAAGHKFQYSHASQAFFPLSIHDDHSLIEDLCEQFEDPAYRLDAQHKNGELQELRQFADELALGTASQPISFHQFSAERFEDALKKFFVFSDSSEDKTLVCQKNQLCCKWIDTNQPIPKFLHDISHTQIFFPCSSPYKLVGGQKINYVIPLGLQPVIDFSVEDVNCYSLGGVVHHNTGKTEGVGGYELTLHLIGRYPPWWQGRKFTYPIKAWACGTTGQTVRDILQRKLLGPINEMGTGLIPGDYIIDTKRRAGSVPDTIETVYVKHSSGGVSTVAFKSYEQGRKAFEGDEQDVVMLDEEPPVDIYTECLTRTMTTQGMVMLMFTPLQGLSDTVLLFMPGGRVPSDMGKRFIIQASWDDAPHLSKKDKEDIISSYSPHERDARTKGIPQLGAGKIYPIDESELLVDDFEIPEYWIQAYGFDVGWKATAAVWGALNRESDVLFLHSCYKQGEEKPIIHAEAIKARGEWIPGISDPAALGRAQRDGKQLMIEYTDLGLKLVPAENPVEAGILKLYKRMTTGRFKVFQSMTPWLEEFRIYRRDEKGKVVKENDHLMDCLHPDTKIITSRGKIKIKDLVDTEGFVLSTNKKWMPYKNCNLISQNKSVVEVLFDDGSHVVCTPDHKFLTPDGWIDAIDLRGLDCYNAISQTIQEKNQCKSINYLKNNKSLMEQFIIYVGNIFSGMELGCIEWYGKTIMEKFLKDIVSTTKIKIFQIMTFLIWNCCYVLYILHSIKKGINDQFLKMLLMQPQNGMAVQMELNGINSIMKISETNCIKKLNSPVNIVGKNLLLRLQGKTDFAQIIVNQHGDADPELIISKKFVLSAEKNLSQTNIEKHRHVQESAWLKCVAIEDAGKSDVYCLEVPGAHAFAVENGAIVHNCSRYLNNSIVSVGKIKPSEYVLPLIPGTHSKVTSGWAR
jgi:phage terminase large subunit-like protein